MSTKQISVGDTLTVGDLTDDHLGAVIEVGEPEGIRYRLTLGSVDVWAAFTRLVTKRGDERRAFSRIAPVTVITPPPVVQPDEPTKLGQCIRIEGCGWFGVVVDPGESESIMDLDGNLWSWPQVLAVAGSRQIIVSDPPRWPDETTEADETLPEVVETLEQWHALPLDERRKFTWANNEAAVAEPVACGGWWYRGGESNLGAGEKGWVAFFDTEFPLTRGERVK